MYGAFKEMNIYYRNGHAFILTTNLQLETRNYNITYVFITKTIYCYLNVKFLILFSGRGDFVGGIDNEALDFSQLEDFINSDSEQPAT